MRLVIFDVDGTLIDSQHHIVGAMEQAFSAVGLPAPTRAETLSIVGLSLPLAIGRLSPDPGAVEPMVDAYKQAFAEMRQTGDVPPLYPGARAVLETLNARDDVLLGIATGKSARGLNALIEAHDLTMFVTRQVADHHPSKPHPSMIQTCLADTGVAPENAAMIGDTSFDMEMAAAADVAGIGVSWGYHPRDHLNAARTTIEAFAELPGALVEIWGGGA